MTRQCTNCNENGHVVQPIMGDEVMEYMWVECPKCNGTKVLPDPNFGVTQTVPGKCPWHD